MAEHLLAKGDELLLSILGGNLAVLDEFLDLTLSLHVALDPLELIQRLVQQIPDPRQHLVRYYGSYANRARHMFRPAAEELDGGGPGGPELDPDADAESEFATERRQSWARLLRKILEVDPLLCPNCQVQMKIVSVITDPVVVDTILRHVDEGGGHDPHAPRAAHAAVCPHRAHRRRKLAPRAPPDGSSRTRALAHDRAMNPVLKIEPRSRGFPRLRESPKRSLAL